VQQARSYAETFGLKFAHATYGADIQETTAGKTFDTQTETSTSTGTAPALGYAT